MNTAPHTNWRQLHGGHFEGLRVLVTGGAGFIGSHLAGTLGVLGASVVILDDLSGGSRENLQHLDGIGKRIEFIEGSVLSTDLLRRAVSGCRYVFHQAALGSVPQSLNDPRAYQAVNSTGTLNVLEAGREANVQRVIFAASASAYGETETLPKVETMPPRPQSPYAATKVAGEALVRAYHHSYGIQTISLRYFNIFGPRQNPHSAYAAVIAAFADAMLSGRRPIIYGDGEQSRDFTFIDNAVHANLLAAAAQRPLGGEVVNIAIGQRTSVNELARLAAEILQRPDLQPVYEPPRAGDVRHSLADLTLARELLGYEPIVDFRAGLEATLRWYAQHLPRA